MSGEKTPKWFTAIPLVYNESPLWWERDAGVLCRGFRELGIDSRFVVIGSRGPDSEPFVFASPADLHNSAWWKQWQLAGVVLYSWGSPRHEPVARAIQESGTKLVIRMDSDGVCSPRVSFRRYLSVTAATFTDAKRFCPSVQALAKTLLVRYLPSVFEDGFRRHLAHADLILIESPIAEQRLKRFLVETGSADIVHRLMLLPQQISPRFRGDPSIKKKRQIIMVGRWTCAQKDAPLLMASLGRALAIDLHCTALIAGGGADLLEKLQVKLPEQVRARISILGKVDQDQLLKYYRESSVIFFASRFEGFPNAAVEALTCGCSVVGPAIIASMNYCTMPACGTVANRRTPEDLSDALLAELSSWDRGERNPEHFSAWWQAQCWAPNVARRILQVFEKPQTTAPP